MQLKYLVYDLETTGTHHLLHGIHELSASVIINNKVKDRINLKICPYPECEYDPKALSACGITKNEIEKFDYEQECYTLFMKFLRKWINIKDKDDKYFLMGYFNLHMDNDFLYEFMGRNAVTINPYTKYFWSGALDVSVLALDYLQKERAKLMDFKLDTVAKYLGIEVLKSKLHGADYDKQLTWEIYKKVKGL